MTHRLVRSVAACSAVALVLAASLARAQSPRADLVLVNGAVVTVDQSRPRAEAVAVRGDRIMAVGTNAEVRRLAGPATRVVDLRGRLLIPGFIEGHGHFTGLGESKLVLDLTTATTWDDIVAMVGTSARAARPGAWIVGRGWHQELLH